LKIDNGKLIIENGKLKIDNGKWKIDIKIILDLNLYNYLPHT